MLATELLKNDHAEVTQLFHSLRGSSDARRQQEVLDQIAEELEIHAQIEEEIFYPAVQSVSHLVPHSREEHNHIRTAIGAVEGKDPGSREFEERLGELQSAVQEHVQEEEGQMFPEARRLGDERLAQLGQQLQERKQTLKESIIQRGIRGVKLAAKKVA